MTEDRSASSPGRRLPAGMNVILLFFVLVVSLACHKPIQYQEDQLVVIIGARVEVSECTPEENPPEYSLDYCARGKFKVLETVYGRINTSTVSFLSFNHYGHPSFDKWGLLYLTYHDGQFYECKYLFTPLYKTKDGRWAAPYFVFDYDHPFNKETKIAPIPIEFKEEVTFDVSGLEPDVIARNYPAPFYQIDGNKAIAKYGNYVNELFQLKKDGVLKARGYFK